MKQLYFLIFLFTFPILLSGQNNTDFWFAAPEVTSGHGDQPIYIHVTSFNQDANVTISEPANTVNFSPITLTIPANSTITYDLTPRKDMVECKPPDAILNLGILIHSDVPITTYYEVANYLNPELFTLKGNNALGTSFYIPSQDVLYNHTPLNPEAYNSFDIIATTDATTLTITPKKPIVGHAKGVPFTVTLNKGQVYSAQATGQNGTDHLMGSTVTSDKPVAITVKDDSDQYPGQGCYDLTGDQIVPVPITGMQYIVVRGYTNTTVNDWVFVTATADNTNISVDGTLVATINAGETYHFNMTSTKLYSYVQTDLPVYLWHLTGYGCETGSALLPPMNCTGSTQVAFSRTTQFGFQLIILTKAGAQGSFIMDGNPGIVTAAMFSPVTSNPAFVYARIDLPVGTLGVGAHILANTQDIFHMGIIHTYDAGQSGCSYGYFSDFASLNLGPDRTVCAGTSVTLDAGPNRQSYTWYFNGNLFASGVQTITITNPGLYSVTVDDHGCILSDDYLLSNYPVPTPVITGITSFCEGVSQQLSVQDTYSDYLWSTGATTQSIYVDVSGNYSVTVTDNNGCQGSSSVDVVVHTLPVVTLNQPSPTCTNIPPYALTGGSPPGGIYSGNGVNSATGFFDPASGAGPHDIIYTYTDAFDCTNSDLKTLMVYEAPVVQLADFTPVCVSVPPFLLSGGNPTGGVYSGSGVNSSTGFFDPSSGTGPHSITYTYTDVNGCINAATKILTVNPLPIVQLSPQPSVCISAPSFPLTGGTPSGGTYSGPGVNSGTGFFDPSSGAGPHTITYTYTDANGCSGSDSKTLFVNPLPVVQLAALNPVCISVPPFPLSGGSPPGGVYSGSGVNSTTGIFDPASGAGSHIIIYTYTDVLGCTNSDSKTLIVYETPLVQLADFNPVCISVPPFQLSGGSPAGGVYSGSGVNSSTGFFDPASGLGPHSITYTYIDPNGCGNAATKTLTVNPLPVVLLSAQASVCISAPSFPLTGGTPAGGTYSGPGVNSATGSFDPSSGAGPHTITYTYTDANGCSAADSKILTVNPLPVVQLGAFNPVCISVPPFLLSGGSPAGGFYSGPGVNSTTAYFDPSSGAGSHTITYTFTDANGCTNFDFKSLVVNPLPIVHLAAQAPVCITALPFSLNGGTPVGGIYSGTGVNSSNGFFNPASGAGIHVITYTFTDANYCTNLATSDLIVIPLPTPAGTLIGPDPDCEGTQNIAYNLSGADPLATSFVWDISPVSAGTISGTTTSPSVSLNTGYSGIIGIRFLPVSDCGAGTMSAYTNITVNPNPVVWLQACNDPVSSRGAKPFQLKGGIPPGGVFSIDGTPLPSDVLDPSVLSPSPPDHTISYTYTNHYNCATTKSQPLKINNASGFVCTANLTDIRDLKTYPTFEIVIAGIHRCWMSANLDYGKFTLGDVVQSDNCIPEKYCEGDDPLKCSASGGLYQWDELMNYLPADNTYTEGQQGLCPPEWHVPSEAEWAELETYFQGPGLAGWSLLDPNPAFGFHGKTRGVFYQNLVWAFMPPGFSASLFWTSSVSPFTNTRIFSHGLNTINADVSKYFSTRGNALQVRCVKD